VIPLGRLERLAHKYRTLAALRARREALQAAGADCFDEAEGAQRRRAFRRIARQFPGALRELDTTPAAALAARLDDVERALAGGPVAPWIPVVIDYHLTLREALLVKTWLARRSPRATPLGAATLAIFAARMQRLEALRSRIGLPGLGSPALPATEAEWSALAAHYLRPPQGRVLPLVVEALARRHDLPVDAVRRIVQG